MRVLMMIAVAAVSGCVCFAQCPSTGCAQGELCARGVEGSSCCNAPGAACTPVDAGTPTGCCSGTCGADGGCACLWDRFKGCTADAQCCSGRCADAGFGTNWCLLADGG